MRSPSSSSPRLAKVVESAERAVGTGASILLVGTTSTGCLFSGSAIVDQVSLTACLIFVACVVIRLDCCDATVVGILCCSSCVGRYAGLGC
jgi:hypothetical protein